MLNDFVLNLLVSVIWAALISYGFMKIFYKKFDIKVETFSTHITMKYQYGFQKGEARVILSADVLRPVLTKGFNGFNFVLPLTMTHQEAVQWLQEIEVNRMYAEKGKDTMELLRAFLLGYATVDLEDYKVFNLRCNYLKILLQIRKHRKLLKGFLKAANPECNYTLPLVSPVWAKSL